MRVRFWGTRGSIATPGPRTARYGGNTACVEVMTNHGTLVVLDCGTGARELGLSLKQSPDRFPPGSRIHILIGHTHWDHIQGFPFFLPSLLADYQIAIYAPAGFERSLEDAIAGQMQYSYFPVRLHELPAAIEFTELEEGTFRIEDITVQTQYLNHTAPTLGYRLTADGATVVYSTDHEPFWDPDDAGLQHPGDQRHAAFLTDADLVIHDAQYTAEEYRSKVSWGHSSIDYAVAVTRQAGARRLAFFHHDPLHDDARMDAIAAAAAAQAGPLDVFAAAEGQEILLSPQGGSLHPVPDISALGRRALAGARVLVATSSLPEIQLVTEILTEEGLKVSSVQDGDGALAMVRVLRPDLIVVDESLQTRDGRSVAAALRAGRATRVVPILLLVPRPAAADHLGGDRATATEFLTDGSSDWIAKPFSPPMLRSRVRAWLARTAEAISWGAAGPRAARTRVRGATARLADRAEFLATIPLFSAVAPIERWRLAGRLAERVFPAGTEILVEGDPGDALYVIRTGVVRVTGRLNGQRSIETHLEELGPGEVFGELSLIDGQPRAATIAALRRTRCLVLGQADFRELIGRSPEFTLGLLRVEAHRLRQTDSNLVRESPDALTGLPGRRALADAYQRMAAGVRRRGTGLGLLLVDLDHLKPINDRYGHLTGDRALRRLADVLRTSVRAADLVARWGGDEFVVLLSDATPAGVRKTSARIQRTLAARVLDKDLSVTIEASVGTAWSADPPADQDILFAEADLSLRLIKRNRLTKALPAPPAVNALPRVVPISD